MSEENVPAKAEEMKKDEPTKDSTGMKSPDMRSNQDGPRSDSLNNSNSKFMMTGGPGVYSKMLMTGMGSLGVDGAQTHMMQAKNNLKMMHHQQLTLEARLIKLSKEEERAQKRIRDAERKAEFIANMHQQKQEKFMMKQSMYKEMHDKELMNRERINHHRAQTKDNINHNKFAVHENNRHARSAIKDLQIKIRDNIHQNKVKMAQDKQRNAKELYEMKKRAKYQRDAADQFFNASTQNLYNQRISETNQNAQYINNLTKQLEEKEAAMLAKLQQTYTHEKQVVKKLNELAALSPVPKTTNHRNNKSMIMKSFNGAVDQSLE